MNNEHLELLFKENIFSDISITLKDAKQSIHISGHRIVLIKNDYFKNLLTGPLKEKDTTDITLDVSNATICKDIIMSLYDIAIESSKFSNHRYVLQYIKCCDYWLLSYENILMDKLKVPEEDFNLLLEIGELMNYSDRILKIIARNIPLEYDLSGIPSELKERMIKLNQKNIIVSGCYDDSTIQIWDLDTETVIKSLKGHTDSVFCVCHIPEKNQIVSGSSDNTIKIWDLNTGSEIKSLEGHKKRVNSVCYIREKNQIVSSSDDCTIKIWDLNTGLEIKSLEGHKVCANSVCYIPGKNQIASGGSDNTIKIWDLDTGVEIQILRGHCHRVFDVCYIPDKNFIASASADSTIKIWDLEKGTNIRTLIGHQSSVKSLCHVQDKNLIISGSSDNKIKIWNLDTGKESFGIQPRSDVVPTGKESFGIQPRSDIVPTGTEIKTLNGHSRAVYSVCYIPEKNQIASSSDDKTIKIWDLDTGKLISTLIDQNKVLCLCYAKLDNDITHRLKN